MPFTFQDGSPLVSYCAFHFHFPGWLTSLRLLCLSSRLEQDPRIRPRLTTSPSGFTTGGDFFASNGKQIIFSSLIRWWLVKITFGILPHHWYAVPPFQLYNPPYRNYQNCHHLTCRFTSAFLFLATALLALNNFFGKVNLQLLLRGLNWEGVSKA